MEITLLAVKGAVVKRLVGGRNVPDTDTRWWTSEVVIPVDLGNDEIGGSPGAESEF